MITQIDHIELIVRDVDEYCDFLQKLGFKLLLKSGHHGGSAELQLDGPNQPIIEIHTVIGEEVPGLNHIAYRVDNVQAAYEDYLSKGIVIPKEPKFGAVTGRTNINFRDPDGQRVQIVDEKRKAPAGDD